MIFNYDSHFALKSQTSLSGIPFNLVTLFEKSAITTYFQANEINRVLYGVELGDQENVLLNASEVAKMILTEAFLGNEKAISFIYPLILVTIKFRLTYKDNPEHRRIVNEFSVREEMIKGLDSWEEQEITDDLTNCLT